MGHVAEGALILGRKGMLPGKKSEKRDQDR